jgi:hypothetical protein
VPASQLREIIIRQAVTTPQQYLILAWVVLILGAMTDDGGAAERVEEDA